MPNTYTVFLRSIFTGTGNPVTVNTVGVGLTGADGGVVGGEG